MRTGSTHRQTGLLGSADAARTARPRPVSRAWARRPLRRILTALLVGAVVVSTPLLPSDANTRTVSLRWTAGDGPPALGFVVILGKTSGSYDRAQPVGLPAEVGGVYTFEVQMEAEVDQYAAVLAFNAAGPSEPSNELHFPPIELPQVGDAPVIALGRDAPDGRTLLVDADGGFFQAAGSTSPSAGEHVAWCNLDGDDDLDLVLGQGPAGSGQVVVVRGLSRFPSAVLGNPESASTRPACGDIDGDGFDEIVVGLDPGSGGPIRIFDDLTQNLLPFTAPGLDPTGRLPWPAWQHGEPILGAAVPATGDLDGDGVDEIVLGLTSGSGGALQILDDLRVGVRPFEAGPIEAGWLATGLASPDLWPALGDADGDGRDELAVGFDSGGEGGGYGAFVRIFDDPIEAPTAASWTGLIQAGTPSLGATRTFPAFGDLDQDGEAELIVGFGPDTVHGLAVWTDLLGTPRPFGETGWIYVAGHGLAGELRPALRAETEGVEPPTVVIGGGPIGNMLHGVRIDGSTPSILAAAISNGLPTRLVGCNSADNPLSELIAGYGPGGEGSARLGFVVGSVLTNGPELVVGPGDYGAANGEWHPACGDLDGDGRDEIIFGPGPGGNGSIWIREDFNRGFAPWDGASDGEVQWTDWGTYMLYGGGARPAAGDLDGDGRDEIVIGLEYGGAGWIRILDDASTGFRPMEAPGLADGWLRWNLDPMYVATVGSARVSVGDVDGDGREEIALGVDAGGRGHIALLDDAEAGFGFLLGAPGETAAHDLEGIGDGATHPALIDVDADGRDELVIGFGVGGEDRLYIIDDALAGLAPHPATPGGTGFLALPPGIQAPVQPTSLR